MGKLLQNELSVNTLLKDFYALTGIKICIFDSSGKERQFYPDQYTSFCKYLRSNKELDNKCKECDSLAFKQCIFNKTKKIYHCHVGLTECLVPIIINNTIRAFVSVGQFKDNLHQFYDIKDLPEDIDKDLLKKYYDEIITFDKDKIQSIVHILETCASYETLINYLHDIEEKPIDKIISYIQKNINSNLTIDSIGTDLNMSRRLIYTSCHKAFNISPANLIKRERLKKAQQLLLETNDSITEIAEQIGFYDYNYFSKIFKKELGISPNSYRKQNKSIY